MSTLTVLALGSLILALLLWWGFAAVVLPARELLAVLRRLAAGDLRPMILPGNPGPFRGAAAALRHLAETLARQKELLAREEFGLTMILGSMSEGVVITGPDLRIRQLNAAAARMLGLNGPVTGLLLPEVFRSHELQEAVRRVAAGGAPEHAELTFGLSGRGDRSHLLVTAAALKDREGSRPGGGLLLVIHDITRLRELESVRREFIANVSHEFRTPLSVINGYLETLEDHLAEGEPDPEILQQAVGAMRRHGERLNRLIGDLLTISRMEEKGVRLETVEKDLGELLRGVVSQFEREIAQRGADVVLDLSGELPRAEVDAYRIEQAFSNLLANALRHGAAAGGRVVIRTEPHPEGVAVSFRDNGPGIPLQDQEHLFERFYRVGGDRARQSGGTGLGLSIVKHVVTAHGGSVVLESLPGKGALFSVILPVTRPAG